MYQHSYSNIFRSIWSNDFEKVEHVVVERRRGGEVWMAINNFARSPLFTRERWRNRFPLVMGKQTEKTNRFRKEEDWTQNQICTTRVSRRIGVGGLFDIHCTGKFLEGARLQILPFYLFWDDVLLCTSRQSEYTDMAS